MGKYKKGDHVKVEVTDDQFPVGEWMWILVEESDDEKQLVFGRLDNEPIAASDLTFEDSRIAALMVSSLTIIPV